MPLFENQDLWYTYLKSKPLITASGRPFRTQLEMGDIFGILKNGGVHAYASIVDFS
jgi:hypothetical protein